MAVVNETVARHFYPKGDAVGQSIKIDGSTVQGPWQIVGVAKDTKSRNPREVSPRMVYVPIAQIAATTLGEKGPEPNSDRYASTIELRTAGNPALTVRDLRNAMAAIDPSIPVPRIQTISEEVNGLMSGEALVTRLMEIFSVLALVLAGIGLYGVMSYNVIRRTPEIGIRLALGARLGAVQWMVLRESLGLLAVGIGVGLPVTVATAILIRKQLFELSAIDPVTFAVAIAVVTGMTLFAAWLPAKRATRIDPMVALRAD